MKECFTIQIVYEDGGSGTFYKTFWIAEERSAGHYTLDDHVNIILEQILPYSIIELWNHRYIKMVCIGRFGRFGSGKLIRPDSKIRDIFNESGMTEQAYSFRVYIEPAD